MLSFLVLTSRTGERLGRDELTRIAREVETRLPFEPESHVAWSASRGRVAVLAWDLHPDGYPEGPRWFVDEHGFVAFGGMAHPVGHGWRHGSWARQLGEAFRRGTNGPELPDRFWGVFTALYVTPSGTGYVGADPLSMGALYVARTDDVTAISNRPDVAATAVGGYHRRDAEGVGWLLANDYILDDRTSFTDIRSLPAGVGLRIDGDDASVQEVRVDAGLWDDDVPPYQDALGAVAVDLLDHISTVADLDRRVQLTLSGGRDSRLVLAMAMAAGVEKSFCYMTAESFPGEVDPDVIVASMIAEQFGLDHRVLRLNNHGISSVDLDHRVRVHAHTTSAMIGAKSHRASLRVAGHTQISGAFGDILTGPRTGDAPAGSVDEAEAFLIARMHGGAGPGLLTRDAKQHYLGEQRRIVDAIAADGAPPEEIPYRFYVNHILHNWLPNELHIKGIAPNIEPLYSKHIPAAARAAGWHGRRSFRLHFDLMQASAPELTTVPFAAYGWPDRLVDQLLDGDRFRVPPITGSKGPRGLRGLRWEDHVGVFRRYLLDDAGNPVNDLLDRPVLEAVLAGERPLPPGGLIQLHNALGAAVWLGGHEQPVAPVTANAIARAHRSAHVGRA